MEKTIELLKSKIEELEERLSDLTEDYDDLKKASLSLWDECQKLMNGKQIDRINRTNSRDVMEVER